MGKESSSETVKSQLRVLTDPFWVRRGRTYAGFTDTGFYLPSIHETRQVLQTVVVSNAGTSGEKFDCDDYSFSFKGNVALYCRDNIQTDFSMCIGISWAYYSWSGGELHAINWVLCDDNSFYWIEPQDNSLHSLNECRGGLELLLV